MQIKQKNHARVKKSRTSVRPGSAHDIAKKKTGKKKNLTAHKRNRWSCISVKNGVEPSASESGRLLKNTFSFD